MFSQALETPDVAVCILVGGDMMKGRSIMRTDYTIRNLIAKKGGRNPKNWKNWGRKIGDGALEHFRGFRFDRLTGILLE